MEEIQGWNAWADQYKPIDNPVVKSAGTKMFETFGAELEYVQSRGNNYVWTWVTGDMSDLLVAGYAYVNRLGYYVSEVPWEDEDTTVLISVERECDCYSEDDDVMASRNEEYGDPDCDKCEGAGLYTEYVG